MNYARSLTEPLYGTAITNMTPAGQTLTRGLQALILRSPALQPHLWIGSGWRTGSSEHATGRALDVIAGKVGTRARTGNPAAYTAMQRLISDVLVPHAQALGIRHILWDRRIYRVRYRAWAALPGRDKDSSVSDWHEDHAHIWLDSAGAGWTGALDRLILTPTGTSTISGVPPKPVPPARPTLLSYPIRRRTVSLAVLQEQAKATGKARVRRESVETVQECLRLDGRQPGPVDGLWGPRTATAYAAHQRACGWKGKDADGIPGRESLAKLAATHGFRAS